MSLNKLIKNKHKNIMHLIASNFFGGPEKQIVQHLLRLNRNNFRSIIASFIENDTKNELLEKAQQYGLLAIPIFMSSAIDFRAQKRLIRLLKKKEIDLLCTHGYKSSIMGWLAGRICNIPVMAFSRGFTSENFKVSFYEWLERRALHLVSDIVAVSEGQRKKLKTYGIKKKNIWVVHNSVSTDSINRNDEHLDISVRKRFNIPLKAKIIVSAGRLSPEKGHKFLISAIKNLNLENDFARFLFCGDGVCKADLKKQALEQGVENVCIFPGFRKDLNEIFRVMDLFVLPSLTEGLPNVLLEAFSYAKPVVTTAVGGIPELVSNRHNGLLVPPNRPDLLAHAIHECLSNIEFSKSLGINGYDRVKTKFTFNAQTKKLEFIYDSVLKKYHYDRDLNGNFAN